MDQYRKAAQDVAPKVQSGSRVLEVEDRMLQNALNGYEEYASRVRYRLIPGVW